MSYPYGQFTSGDDYSNPTTPLDGFPQWETVEREQEQQLQQSPQQPPPQQQSQEQQLHHSPTQPTPTFQLIHLEDVHSQPFEPSSQPSGSLESGAVDTAPVHLHHVHHDPTRSVDVRLETLENELFSTLGYSDYEASSSSASAATGAKQAGGTSIGGPTPSGGSVPSSLVMRSARSTRQFHQSTHPYQRPPSASATGVTHVAGPSSSSASVSAVAAAAGPGSSANRSTLREAQVSGPGPLRFVHHNLIPRTVQATPPLPLSLITVAASLAASTSGSAVQSAVPSAMPSPAMPSPASTSGGRMVGLGSVAGSPVAQLQQSTLLHVSPQIPDNPPLGIQSQRQKYTIRTDTHYEPERGILLVNLELPGVDKKDVKLSLTTSRHNRIRQLRVWGVLDPTFPVPSAEILRLFPESCARERRFGEFSRTFAVPSDLKREHVQAVMKKGILTLRIQLGPPADGQDVQDIPVN